MKERNSTKLRPRKRKRDSHSEADWFGLLPDHIIASILSWLSLREAVKTSVLARRWENLWRLRFSADLVFCDDREPNRFYSSPRHLVAWVDRILKSSRKQPVNEFTIRFYLNSHFSETVKSWLAFALKKNVKRLHLDLVSFSREDGLCVFPDLRKLSTLPPVYSNLKDVYLCYFKIDETLFHYFLSKCPSLERLCLRSIGGLMRLNATGQTLKYLEVVRCSELKVVVSAPNLTSMNYEGAEHNLEMGSIPHLSEFSFAGMCTKFYVKQFARNFSFATQLTVLKFELSLWGVEESISYPQELTAFTVLKHLVIKMDLEEHHSLLWLICLINAAPLLHKFKVEMGTWLNDEYLWNKKLHGPSGRTIWNVPPRYIWNGELKLGNAKIDGHKCLKVVEFHGFANLENQWELVKHILEIAQSLEEIVLNLDISKTSWRAYTYMRDAKAIAERLVAPLTKLVLRNSSQSTPSLAPFLVACDS